MSGDRAVSRLKGCSIQTNWRRLTLSLLFLCIWMASLTLAAASSGNPSDSPAFLEGILQAPQPSGPGMRGSHVRLVQQALVALGYLVDEAHGHYDTNTALAMAAFQQTMGLEVHGRADSASIQLLFGGEGLRPSAKPQRPYWYGGGSDIVPWGAQFEVLDVRSGLLFSCVRIQGRSHLDAEPLTPYDSHTMLTAYGGQWQWDRRPILLRYRGQVIAASMMGMPHGYEVVPDNGMVGHFCIHFNGSRGDGTQRVDARHQACVAEAARAVWPE